MISPALDLTIPGTERPERVTFFVEKRGDKFVVVRKSNLRRVGQSTILPFDLAAEAFLFAEMCQALWDGAHLEQDETGNISIVRHTALIIKAKEIIE